MTEDIKNDVPGTVPEGAVPSAAEPPKPPEPSADEVLNQKIAEAVAKAVAEETTKAQRAIQSAKDKATAEVQAAQRRARLAEGATGAIRQRLQSVDPDVAKEIELEEYRARERERQALEQEEQATQYQAEVARRFQENLNQFVIGLGVDPVDKRIDWAGDAPDLLTRQSRILESVAKIQKENVAALNKSIDDKIKDAEKRIKKDLGAEEDPNSVSAQMSGGVSGSGIPTDMTKFRTWVAGLSVDEYAKKKPEIEKMLAENKIK